MSITQTLERMISEPAPDLLFEITEGSLAGAFTADPAKRSEQILDERGAIASPAAVNLLKPQLYRDALGRIIAANAGRQRRLSAALVIPDYAIRMAVLDFEEFPPEDAERLSLLRFRLRKSVPFPIEDAQISYSIQTEAAGRIEVLSAVIARPILSEYEELFAAANYRIGAVQPSSLAAMRLCPDNERALSVLIKMAGTILTVLLLESGRVRLIRCLDLTGDDPVSGERQVLSSLQQTLAYAEDQLRQPATQLFVSGFGRDTESLSRRATAELGMECAPLRSKHGTASQANAGLLGLLEQYAA